ncbi:hypothetical protein OL239_08190 [Arthrobacter sp. ATA002]|uniref:hypothetical protein n=1 Tax=Arthrobacter sp. ATA002 TaxID=2991715 RepID=UPI0022A79BA1|nr:hypothetical protein [Arthrobacter sp. ATA002]WAP53055.1 hypothetical protein OL239_08190 [Arthrobacter sp. ATA002]
MNKVHKAVSTGLAAALMMGLAGCGSSDSGSSAVEPSADAASSAPALPEEVNGLPVKTLANDGKGEYLQTTLDEDDPALDYDSSIVHPTALDLFSAEEIEAGQKFAMYFAAEEFMDSTLNGNPDDPEAMQEWWDENGDSFHSDHAEEIRSVLDSAVIVIRGSLREPNDLTYGPDKGHVLSRSLVPAEIYGAVYEGDDLLGVSADFEVEHALVLDGTETPDPVSGTVKLLLKQEDSGEWKIAGTNSMVVMKPVQ